MLISTGIGIPLVQQLGLVFAVLACFIIGLVLEKIPLNKKLDFPFFIIMGMIGGGVLLVLSVAWVFYGCFEAAKIVCRYFDWPME